MFNYSIVKIVTVITAAIVSLALNMFLSTRKNPVFAFILPLLSFLFSLAFLVFGISAVLGDNASENLSKVFITFFFLNVPTLVFVLTSIVTRYIYKNLYSGR